MEMPKTITKKYLVASLYRNGKYESESLFSGIYDYTSYASYRYLDLDYLEVEQDVIEHPNPVWVGDESLLTAHDFRDDEEIEDLLNKVAEVAGNGISFKNPYFITVTFYITASTEKKMLINIKDDYKGYIRSAARE